MNKITKLGYYLSIAYYDIPFRFFFSILTLKLILFIYTAGIGLGIDSFLPSFGAILITLAFSLLIRNKFYKFAYLFILDILYSLLFFIQSLYLKYFDDFASVYNLVQIHQLPSVADSVINLTGKELFFVLDIVFIPLYIRLKQVGICGGQEKIKASIILFLLGLYCNTGLLRDYVGSDSYFLSVFDRTVFVRYFGIVNYQAMDAHNFLTRAVGKGRVTENEINLVNDWGKKHNGLVKNNDLARIGKGMNLAIIQVESLQNFVIGKKYHDVEITPNLNRLAKAGIYFKDIYDQTADGNTSDATLLANASLFPAKKGAASFLYPASCFDSLPKILREYGYSTATMHAHVSSYWNRAAFEKALGFEWQFYKDDYIITDVVGLGLGDKAFFSQSLEKIKGLPAPFYVFLQTLSSHDPFNYVTHDIDNFPLKDIDGEFIGSYIRSMHYVDSAIGEFLQKLSESNLGLNTAVVVYGDHRARFSESDLRKIGVIDMREKRKIPLIISLPYRRHGDVRDAIGGLIDVAPTICNILGIDISHKLFVGKDLGNKESSFVIFRDGSYIGANMNKISASQSLMISDLILEKDIISTIRHGQSCKE